MDIKPQIPENTPQNAVVRFAGDSGDGMQLVGTQFSMATALNQQDMTTFPDYPAEIRAPQGTTYGVSAFQIHFGSDIQTIGDQLDVLICMNPAALKVNIDDLKIGGLIIVDEGAFTPNALKKAGYMNNPLEDETLSKFRLLKIDISNRALSAVIEAGFDKAFGLKARNIWALGLVYWLFGRDCAPTLTWLEQKFKKSKPDIYQANVTALNAGNLYGEVVGMPSDISPITTQKANMPKGLYMTATGYETLSWGLLTGSKLAGLDMVLCSYPITPASTMLHTLTQLSDYGVKPFQAEDEIAAICAAISASWVGDLGVTTSSGPGIALKTEAMGLAVATELPLIIVNVQRGGPSTGLPTKTEQSDLLQAVWGRNGDCPMIILAAKSPASAFNLAVDAVRYATKYMTPVMILSDGFIANASEPFLVPKLEDYTPFPVSFRTAAENFATYNRDKETLARDWVKVGTKDLQHRIGGLERDAHSGSVSTDPENHQIMTNLRKKKVLNIANEYPPLSFEYGEDQGDVVVLGWGSTWGAIRQAVQRACKEGYNVSHLHLEHIWPLPCDLKEKLSGFKTVIIPEMNTGQLSHIIRSETLVDAQPLNKIQGKPFHVSEIYNAILKGLKG